VSDHVQHIIDLVGEDHVGIGTDVKVVGATS
jgi:microsomal dipeptidase-like Zn-dependent dipeptidase